MSQLGALSIVTCTAVLENLECDKSCDVFEDDHYGADVSFPVFVTRYGKSSPNRKRYYFLYKKQLHDASVPSIRPPASRRSISKGPGCRDVGQCLLTH